MKKKTQVLILLLLGAVAALALLLWVVNEHLCMNSCDVPEVWSAGQTVQFLEHTSDSEFSSYQVGTTLQGTDFSHLGQILTQKMEEEWRTYDGMTREQIIVSSHLWGIVGIQSNTWEESGDAIGLAVENPLETLEWLEKTGYYGSESTIADMPVKHVQAIANASETHDRSISQINITAGYCTQKVQVTLTATLRSKTGPFEIGNTSNGYATYTHDTITVKSGIPVLIVTTEEANNTGYYHSNFFDPTAYWVKDHVFYTLRVFGEETDKEEITATLNRILAQIS